MLVHNQSQRHAAAVEKAARMAAAVARERCSSCDTADSTTAHPHHLTTPQKMGPIPDDGDCQDESGQALVDIQQAQTAPHCTIPDHIQALFEANKYEKPDIGGFIRAGLTDEQVTWYDALQVARYSVSEKYPVDLDEMWQCVGFPRKDLAVRTLKQHLTLELHYLTLPQNCGGYKENTAYSGPAPDRYFMTLEAAQHLAMGAPGKNGRHVRDMYIRVVQRVQDYEILTRLYASFESARQAHHDAIVANVTDKRCAYLSQIMLVNGEKRRKGGYTDDTPKARYTSGLKDQFGAGPAGSFLIGWRWYPTPRKSSSACSQVGVRSPRQSGHPAERSRDDGDLQRRGHDGEADPQRVQPHREAVWHVSAGHQRG